MTTTRKSSTFDVALQTWAAGFDYLLTPFGGSNPKQEFLDVASPLEEAHLALYKKLGYGPGTKYPAQSLSVPSVPSVPVPPTILQDAQGMMNLGPGQMPNPWNFRHDRSGREWILDLYAVKAKSKTTIMNTGLLALLTGAITLLFW